MNPTGGNNTGGELTPHVPGSPMRRRIILAVSLYLLYFAGCLLVEGISRRQFQVHPDCEIPQAADERTHFLTQVENMEHRLAMNQGSLYHGYDIAKTALAWAAGVAAAIAVLWMFRPRKAGSRDDRLYRRVSIRFLLAPTALAALCGGMILPLLPAGFAWLYYDNCFVPAWLR
jgi:hypothetical protein